MTEFEFGTHLEWLLNDPLLEINREKLARLSRGEQLFDLSMINPDLLPPRYCLDRLVEAGLKPLNHRYAVSRGIRKLREAFAAKYASKFSVALNPELEICATMGSKDALLQTLRCAASPGERVLLARPLYPAHLSAVRLAGLGYDFFDLSRNETELVRRIVDALEHGDFRVLLLNFPNNPTGIRVSENFYREVVSECWKRNVVVLNDFVYGEMQFNGTPAASLLAAAKGLHGVAEIYSLSKAYSVPGWRVGAVSGDASLIALLYRLKSRVDYGIFLPIQMAAASALTCADDLTTEITSEYRRRCELLVEGLQRLGWELTMPEAGASVWARIPKGLRGAFAGPSLSVSFALHLLQTQGVQVLPGVLFGEQFDHFVRFAMVVNDEGLRHVIDKLELFQAGLCDAQQSAIAQ